MTLSDQAILERLELPADDWRALRIEPFSRTQKAKPGEVPFIGFGLSSGGYDFRLGNEYLMFSNIDQRGVLDPKTISAQIATGTLDKQFIKHVGDNCLIPANSFVLAKSLETYQIPEDVICTVLGKSTYARCGIHLTLTPLEPGWCAADDTELLTASGWRLLREAAVGDMVLTRRADGVAEYQPVLAKQALGYDGNLLHFCGRSVNQLVTPDHKMFVHRRTVANTFTEFRPASEVFSRHNFSLDRVVNWTGDQPKTLDIAGRSWDAGDFLEFYGSWLGDGSAYLGSDGGYHVKLAVVTKEEKRRKFFDALTRLDIRFREHERGFEFFAKPLCLWLREHGHARSKFVRREFMNLHPDLLNRLLDGLMQSDGCALTDAFKTTSPQLADDVQELCFKTGKAAIVRNTRDVLHGNTVNAYVVRRCDDHMTPKINPSRHYLEPFRGTVYDVTVPNSTFFCRRDGKASWTGNCGVITVEIANLTPSPALVHSYEGIGQILFHQLDRRSGLPYNKKNGSYQNQTGVTLPQAY